jgi:Na+/H+ antiporter NhaC
MLPIGVPMATVLGAPLPLTVASVLAGGVFGDHCSPISDTTIISSMAAGSDHIDHVNTQLPYAVAVAAVAALLFLAAGYLLR